MTAGHDMVDHEYDDDSDFPWATPDHMQYKKAQAALDDSLKNLSRKSFRDLVQNLAIEKFGDPDLKLVSHEPMIVGF